MKYPAVFLDRDGTIIKDNGYLRSPEEVEFYPETFTSLRKLQEGFRLFIITNQSGIAKGITRANEVEQVNDFVLKTLKSEGIVISELYCCPHSSEDKCRCKKPSPYFIQQAAELYDLDLENSYIIGDHPSDVECGLNAGIKSIYLLTGHGEKHKNELLRAYPICENISVATQLIYKN